MARNGCGQSGHGTLKLAVSQEWIDAMNWFLVCWCKFKNTKSCFNDFLVGQVKNGYGHLVHEILKSAEWAYGLSWFFACWLWCNNFWLDQHRTFVSLTFKCQSTGVVLGSPLVVAGRILWNRVNLSFLPDICQSVFVKFDHEVFLNFAMVLEKLFCSKNWGNGQKIGFLKKVVIIFTEFVL